MGDLNRDLRVVWEMDYSHLIGRQVGTPPRKYFWYKGYEFQLTSVYPSLFVMGMNNLSNNIVGIDIKELKSKYFLDILNPSKNEIVLFELEYGFEWPFQEKNKKISYEEQGK